MKKVEVVAAVIKNKNKILAVQRGYGEFRGRWEFPGGKIEKDEKREDALKREIKEELDIEINVLDFLVTVNYDYPKFHLIMHTYLAEISSGEINLLEHLDMKWLEKEKIGNVDWLEADLDIVDKLKSRI